MAYIMRIPTHRSTGRWGEAWESETGELFGNLWRDFSREDYRRLKRREEKILTDSGVSPSGKRCLDVGCGQGVMSQILISQKASHVTAVDLSDISLAMTRAYCSTNENLRLIKVNFLRFQDVPGSYDVVFLNGVMEHCPDPAAVIRHAGYLLGPEGELFICTYGTVGVKSFVLEFCRRIFPAGLKRSLEALMRLFGISALWRYLVLDHLFVPIKWRFSTDEMKDWLDEAGLNLQRAFGENNDGGFLKKLFYGHAVYVLVAKKRGRREGDGGRT